MRVLTLLSHDNPWWCDAALEVPYALPFATMTVMRSQARWSESRNMESQSSSVEVFDLLCLALGLVMNWATLSPEIAVLSKIKCKALPWYGNDGSPGFISDQSHVPSFSPLRSRLSMS